MSRVDLPGRLSSLTSRPTNPPLPSPLTRRCAFGPPGNASRVRGRPQLQAPQPPTRPPAAQSGFSGYRAAVLSGGALARLEMLSLALQALTSRHTNPLWAGVLSDHAYLLADAQQAATALLMPQVTFIGALSN